MFIIMPRPPCPRRLGALPPCPGFRPEGAAGDSNAIELAADAWEALRLADHLGLEQSEAAACMGISRPTFGRLLERARHSVATALVEGRALRFTCPSEAGRECIRCHHRWNAAPSACPACHHRQPILLIHLRPTREPS